MGPSRSGPDDLRTVFPEGDHFFAVAARGLQLLFVRGRWDGTFRTGWRHDAAAAETFYRIERPAPRAAALYAVPLRRPDAPLPPDAGPDPGFLEFFLQLPPDFGAGVLYDLCRDEHDVLWSLHAPSNASGLVLRGHDATGRLIHSRDLGLPADPDACATPTVLVARRGHACVLYRDDLICYTRQGQRPIPLHRCPTDMRVSNPHVVPRVVVTFDEGGAVVWPETGHAVRVGEGLLDPVACFTGGGDLVVVGRGRGMTLRVDPDGIKNVRSFDHPGDPPLAVTPAGDGNTFATFLPDGLVRVMRLPPE